MAAPMGTAPPGATGTANTATGRRASASREAALTLGGVSEAAAQPRDTAARAQEGEAPVPAATAAPTPTGCGHTAKWGRKATACWDWIGVTAAVGRS